MIKYYRTSVLKGEQEYAIPTAEYDLILAVSALEHIDTKQHVIDKLQEIAHDIKKNGLVKERYSEMLRRHTNWNQRRRVFLRICGL